MFLAQKGGAEAGRPRPGGTEPFPALSPSAAYLLGGRLAVVGLVLLAQEEAGHLHLGGTAVGDIAIAARLAGSGLHLGVGFAWGGKREAGRSDRAPAGAGTKLLSSQPFPLPPSTRRPRLTRRSAGGPAGAVGSVGGPHGRGGRPRGFLRFALPARGRCIGDGRIQLQQGVQVALEHELGHGSGWKGRGA